MNPRIPVVLLFLATLVSAVPVLPSHAEDLDVKIDRMKAKEDKEDIAEDRTNLSKWQQIVTERKSLRDSAKGDYEGNLKKSGPKHKLTKDAKDRLDSAERGLRRAERKLASAQNSLREDEQELSQDYQSLQKDKKD